MKVVILSKSEKAVIRQRMRRATDPVYREAYNAMRRAYYERERNKLNAARRERRKELK